MEYEKNVLNINLVDQHSVVKFVAKSFTYLLVDLQSYDKGFHNLVPLHQPESILLGNFSWIMNTSISGSAIIDSLE